jgi:hypothetical protein
MKETPMRRPALTLLLAWLVCTSLAAAQPAQPAQPLAALAPAETFLALGWSPGPSLEGDLTRDLGALDWPRAGRTLEVLAPLTDDSSFENLLSRYGYLLQGGQSEPPSGNDMFADCPEQRALERLYPVMPDTTLDDAYDAALLSVSTSAYNPVPAVTATLRVEPAVAAQFAAVQRALVRCSERSGTEIVRLREGDVPLLIFGNASDFPVALSRVGSLFVVGNNPEVVRGVLRRVAGSDEASLAQTPFYRQNRALLEGGGVSVALNAAALGGTVESLGGALADAQTKPLLRRTVAALRTLGSFAGALRLEDGELRLESRISVNPQGGDRKLAALLLCRCPAPAPALAPDSSLSVSATHLQPRRLLDYLEGWANLAGRAAGEGVSLRALSRRELGLDLDVALLDWLGNGVTSIVLEPLSPDLGTLLYGQPQVLALETQGSEAARRGLAALGEAVRQGLEQGDFMGDGSLTQLPRETYTYGGVRIERLRFGPTFDFGTAFLGDTLLVGTPAAALEPVIRTAQGYAGALTDDEAFLEARAGAPQTVTQLSYSAISAQLRGLADLTRLTSQPLAFAVAAGLGEMTGGMPGSAELPGFADLLHFTELLPNTLEVLSNHTDTLTGYTWVEESARRSLMRLNLK